MNLSARDLIEKNNPDELSDERRLNMVDLKRLFPDYEALGDVISSSSADTGKQTKVEWVRYYTGQQRILKTFYGRDLLPVYSKIKNINNRHVIKVYDCIYDEVTKNTYVIEESIDGADLRTYIRENGRLSQDESVRILKQICTGVETLHGLNPSIIHNDLKPANIMLRSSGDAVLIDFDISREVKSQSYSKNTQAFGSSGYTSPEHHGNFGQTTPASDVYSLGLILHDMLTGTIQDYDEELDDPENDKAKKLLKRHNTFYNNILYQGPLRPVIERCLSMSPEDRYQDAKTLRMALEPENTINVQKKKKQNKKPPVMLIALLFIIGLIYIGTRKSIILPKDMYSSAVEVEAFPESQSETLTSPTIVEAEELNESIVSETTSVENTVAEYENLVTDETEMNSVSSETINEADNSTREKEEHLTDSILVAAETVNYKIDNEETEVVLSSSAKDVELSAVETTKNAYVIFEEDVISEIKDINMLSIGRLPGNRLGYISLQQGMFVLADTYGNESVFASIEEANTSYGWAIIHDSIKNTSYIFMPKDYKNIRVLQIKEDLSVVEVAHWPLLDAFPSGCENYCDYVTELGEIFINGCVIDTNTWEFIDSYPYDFTINNHHYSIQAQGLVEFTEQGNLVSNIDPNGEFESWNLDSSAYYVNETGIYYMSGGNIYHFDGNEVCIYASWPEDSSTESQYHDLIVFDNSILYYDAENECVKLLRLSK